MDVTQFNDDYFKDIENLVFDSLERFLKESWRNLAELEDSQHTKAPTIASNTNLDAFQVISQGNLGGNFRLTWRNNSN